MTDLPLLGYRSQIRGVRPHLYFTKTHDICRRLLQQYRQNSKTPDAQ